MIETYFTAPRVLDRMRSGPMAAYLGPMAAELQSQDYTRKSIRRQIRNADSFGWWLTEQNLTAGEITDDLVGRYIGGLRRSVRAGYGSQQAGRKCPDPFCEFRAIQGRYLMTYGKAGLG